MRFLADLNGPLPKHLATDFLSKLHYISEDIVGFAFADEDLRRVAFEVRSGREAAVPTIITRCIETADKMSRAFRSFRRNVLVDRMDGLAAFGDDPHPRLEREGEMICYGSGRYGFGSKLCDLMSFFDNEFRALAAHLEAKPRQFPALIGADTLERCRYLRSFPHSLNVVSHLREDLEAIQEFARTASFNGSSLDCDHTAFAAVKCLLSPSVCFHWYAWLADQTLDEPKTVTALGKCFRYESGNLIGLERLWDFTMREIIFAGSSAFILERRQRCIEEVTALFDRWALKYEISSAMDPFFIDDFATQSAFQLAFDLKFEVRAALPYRNSTVAVGSFNYHQDFFGKAFSIKTSGGAAQHTGCVGFGLERMALAFLAQHGLVPTGWPKTVREALT